MNGGGGERHERPTAPEARLRWVSTGISTPASVSGVLILVLAQHSSLATARLQAALSVSPRLPSRLVILG